MPPSEALARRWSDELTSELERPVRVTFGRARRNVVVARSEGRTLHLDLNEHFADAPATIRDALVAWLRSGKRARRASERLDAWIAELAERLGPPPRRRVTIRAAGEAHDLRALARELLAREFAGELPADLERRVTWGRRGTRPARRSLQLGSYEAERNLVRLHPVLDQPAVPRYFVRYVLFHELLHAAQDGSRPRPRAKRERHHDAEFERRERAYPDYERALAWQRRHQRALFRSARTGQPIRDVARHLGDRLRTGAREARQLVQGLLFPEA